MSEVKHPILLYGDTNSHSSYCTLYYMPTFFPWGAHVTITAASVIYPNEPSPGLMFTTHVGYNVWPHSFVPIHSTRPEASEPPRSNRLPYCAYSLHAPKVARLARIWIFEHKGGRVGWLHRRPTNWHRPHFRALIST